jgi:hypothetical protein
MDAKHERLKGLQKNVAQRLDRELQPAIFYNLNDPRSAFENFLSDAGKYGLCSEQVLEEGRALLAQNNPPADKFDMLEFVSKKFRPELNQFL